MTNLPASEVASGESLLPRRVYLAATVCLVVGLGVGYGSRGLQPPGLAQPDSEAVQQLPHTSATVPRLDEMKQMADAQATPLLEKLKSNAIDSALLTQLGAIYHGNHQFKEAAAYYEKAVQADPKNVTLQNKLASSMYRSGNVDGAIAQLHQALAVDPHDANSLFNLGMIRLQGKNDGEGALAAWQKLLKSNPQLSPERKAEVQKLMSDILSTEGRRPAAHKGVQP